MKIKITIKSITCIGSQEITIKQGFCLTSSASPTCPTTTPVCPAALSHQSRRATECLPHRGFRVTSPRFASEPECLLVVAIRHELHCLKALAPSLPLSHHMTRTTSLRQTSWTDYHHMLFSMQPPLCSTKSPSHFGFLLFVPPLLICLACLTLFLIDLFLGNLLQASTV